MNVDHLLKQSCTLSAKAGQDKHGKFAFTAPVTAACRFQQTTRTIVTAQSEKTPIDGVVFLKAATSVSIGDKLIFSGSSYKVLRIDPMVDGAGATRHQELLVQRWNI